jgi:hypothetical protein
VLIRLETLQARIIAVIVQAHIIAVIVQAHIIAVIVQARIIASHCAGTHHRSHCAGTHHRKSLCAVLPHGNPPASMAPQLATAHAYSDDTMHYIEDTVRRRREVPFGQPHVHTDTPCAHSEDTM